jgi:thiamine biosynthesis protein ThiS
LNLTVNTVREAEQYVPRPLQRLFLFERRDQMKVNINGEMRELDGQSVLQLLESLSIDPRKVAVERNLEILPKGEYGSTQLADGDSIEIVHFVGGG